VIFEIYGTEHFPTDDCAILKSIKEANENGVVMVGVAQAHKGGLQDEKFLKNYSDLGILIPNDMTIECAIAKLSYLLGKYKKDAKTIRKLMLKPLRGDVTVQEIDFFSRTSNNCINKILKIMDIDPKSEESNSISTFLTPVIINEFIKKQNLEMLKKFKNEIIMGEKYYHNKTNPLHVAACFGNIEIIQFLIECKVNINGYDEKNRTPLNISCINNHVEASRLLKSKGGKFNNNIQGLGIILTNLAYEGNLDAIKLFYQCGANLLGEDYNKRTLAHIAADEDRVDIIEFILENRLDIMKKDKWGDTPFSNASEILKETLLKYSVKETELKQNLSEESKENKEIK